MKWLALSNGIKGKFIIFYFNINIKKNLVSKILVYF